MPKLSHYTTRGEVSMVDVSAKAVTTRTAAAHAFIFVFISFLLFCFSVVIYFVV